MATPSLDQIATHVLPDRWIRARRQPSFLLILELQRCPNEPALRPPDPEGSELVGVRENAETRFGHYTRARVAVPTEHCARAVDVRRARRDRVSGMHTWREGARGKGRSRKKKLQRNDHMSDTKKARA